MTTASHIFLRLENPARDIRYLRLSTITIALCAIMFFTMLDGFARFGRTPSFIWMVAYGGVFAAFIQNPTRTLTVIARAWPVFLIPALALLSTLWTADPTRTPLAATQFFMTVLIAVHIARHLTTQQMMLALFFGQAAGLIISLLNMGVQFIPSTNPINGTLIGIYGHKTALGYGAILSSFALTAYLAYSGKEVWGILYAILVSPIVFLSQSSTALAGYSALVMLCILLLLRRLRGQNARRVMLFLTLFLLAIAVALIINFSPIYNAFLERLGKSATLTGRTVLWDIALNTWAKSPFLGAGFSAFWHSSYHAMDVAFVHAYVDDRVDGFHNAFLESAVALGGLGFTLLIGMVVIPMVRLLGRTFVDLSLDAIIWLSLLSTYILMTMMFQDVGFKQHSGTYILLTLCYLFANRRA